MKFSLIRLLSGLLFVGAWPITGQAAANFSLSVHARSSAFNPDTGGSTAENYYLTASIFMPPVGYRLTSAGGTVTLSSNGNSASSTPILYASWADFVAAETGQWTLTRDFGGPTETDYFFNVGFGAIMPEPFALTAHRTPEAPANQWTVDFSGPVDHGPFTFSYASSSGSGFYTVPSGTTTLDVTVDPSSPFLSLSTYRFIYTSEFTISVPTTADGIPLADWTLSPFNGYSEGGHLFLAPLPPPAESVPDSAHTIGLLLIGLGTTVGWRRARSKS